jgi:hypothetical protein
METPPGRSDHRHWPRRPAGGHQPGQLGQNLPSLRPAVGLTARFSSPGGRPPISQPHRSVGYSSADSLGSAAARAVATSSAWYCTRPTTPPFDIQSRVTIAVARPSAVGSPGICSNADAAASANESNDVPTAERESFTSLLLRHLHRLVECGAGNAYVEAVTQAIPSGVARLTAYRGHCKS